MSPSFISRLSQQGAFRRLVNLGMLIGGFGLGQGSIFLVQSWLVAKGETEMLALFGTHFSFAILGIVAVEAGSLTILSAQIARQIQSSGATADVWRAYWETTVFRGTVAILLIAAGIAALAFWPLPDFSRSYLVWSLPALLLWAFNAAGFLDGLQKSGVSGLTGSIAYVASAVALFFARGLAPGEAGAWTGAAFSIGYALTIAAQFAALAAAGWRPAWARPSGAGVRTAFVEEGSMLAGLLPGQLYFRAQLAIAAFALGHNATAVLVYAKQIVGAASQIAGFARRVEFPRLVQAVAANPALDAAATMRIQRSSLAIAAAFTVMIALASLAVLALAGGFAVEAWGFLALFCVTVLSESVGQALVQGLFARSRYHAAAVARILAVALAVVFGYVFVSVFGVRVFVLSDLVSHAIVITLSLWWLNKAARAHDVGNQA
jgi:peptidoglycan biosynthesis protein MviN/MurJ (putative lipid II flippase)